MPSCLPLHNYISPDELIEEGSTLEAIVARLSKNQGMIHKSLTVLDQNQRMMFDEYMELDSKFKKVIFHFPLIFPNMQKYFVVSWYQRNYSYS